jgi:predicted unusual protein kinase regulating ubiquinone biosynthesis (AarF/ABC1/UbiB family)
MASDTGSGSRTGQELRWERFACMTGVMVRRNNLPAETRSLPAPIEPDRQSVRNNHLPRDVYDAAAADEIVRFPGCFQDRRIWHILRTLFGFLIYLLKTGLFAGRSADKKEIERRTAERVKQMLIDLGPTYIKLGQFLSVRRDLLPVTVADELATLQDRVPPFSLELLRQTVNAELGAPPERLFAYFDPIPLASASIGQVHRVQLQDGRQAILKVQRAGLAHDFYRDLGLMRLAARICLKLNSAINGWHRFLKKEEPTRPARFDFSNWLEMSDEFGRTLFEEIDYLLEGRNADRLRRLLRDRPEVRIPRVIWKYSARKVLTLEYLEGIKIDRISELKARNIDLEALGNLLITAFLEQVVIKGFFHADPHAGNLAVDRNGCLILYDFGMVGEISEKQRRSLLNCVIGTVNKDSDLLVKSLLDLGVIRAGTNHEAIGRAITPFMDYYAGKSLFDLDFQQLERDIDIVVTERSLRLPANLAYILRAGSSLEGIARTLKPDFSFISAVRPVVKHLVAMEGLEALSTLDGLMQLAGLAVSGLKRASQIGEAVNGNAHKLVPAAREEAKKPGPCRKCVRQSRDLRQLKKSLTTFSFIGLSYVTISIGALVSLNPAILTNYRETGFYIVIGNIILGGIMIGKLIRLSKWNPKSIAADEDQLNGEKKC